MRPLEMASDDPMDTWRELPRSTRCPLRSSTLRKFKNIYLLPTLAQAFIFVSHYNARPGTKPAVMEGHGLRSLSNVHTVRALLVPSKQRLTYFHCISCRGTGGCVARYTVFSPSKQTKNTTFLGGRYTVPATAITALPLVLPRGHKHCQRIPKDVRNLWSRPTRQLSSLGI